jgi:hypothetical protein
MINFKNEKDKMLFTQLALPLIMVYCDLALYAKEKHKIDLVITETITTKEHDKKLGRVSDAHQYGIALDIRANNIDKRIVKELVGYINNRWFYKQFHYLSNSGVSRLAIDHGENENYHIHLQVNRKYAYNSNMVALK